MGFVQGLGMIALVLGVMIVVLVLPDLLDRWLTVGALRRHIARANKKRPVTPSNEDADGVHGSIAG